MGKVSMKARRQQRTRNASSIGRQSVVPVLLFIVCFISIFHTCNAPHPRALQVLDVSAHLATQGKLPNVVHGTHASRLETVFSRAVPWAMISVLNIPALLPPLSRRIESIRERHVLSMLVGFALEVRAPPQYLLF